MGVCVCGGGGGSIIDNVIFLFTICVANSYSTWYCGCALFKEGAVFFVLSCQHPKYWSTGDNQLKKRMAAFSAF